MAKRKLAVYGIPNLEAPTVISLGDVDESMTKKGRVLTAMRSPIAAPHIIPMSVTRMFHPTIGISKETRGVPRGMNGIHVSMVIAAPIPIAKQNNRVITTDILAHTAMLTFNKNRPSKMSGC
jgi:chromate transport protein ChrA